MPSEVKTIRIDQEVFQQTLEKKLSDLPPLPAVVARIMETVNDPHTCAEDLNRLISLDQALSSKMLRIVNSAYYGFPKRISTITHAVVILGFNTVRNLVLGVSAFGMIPPKSGSTGLDRHLFWEHSVASAVAAGIVARRNQPRNRTAVEQAFLGGLLHDIGELFLDCYFPIQYALTQAYAARESMGIVEAEVALLDVEHVSVAKRIAESWNFPPALVASVGGWYQPDPADANFISAAIVQAADWFACNAGMSSCPHLPAPQLDDAVQVFLGYSEADYEEVTQELRDQFSTARDMLSLAA